MYYNIWTIPGLFYIISGVGGCSVLYSYYKICTSIGKILLSLLLFIKSSSSLFFEQLIDKYITNATTSLQLYKTRNQHNSIVFFFIFFLSVNPSVSSGVKQHLDFFTIFAIAFLFFLIFDTLLYLLRGVRYLIFKRGNKPKSLFIKLITWPFRSLTNLLITALTGIIVLLYLSFLDDIVGGGGVDIGGNRSILDNTYTGGIKKEEEREVLTNLSKIIRDRWFNSPVSPRCIFERISSRPNFLMDWAKHIFKSESINGRFNIIWEKLNCSIQKKNFIEKYSITSFNSNIFKTTLDAPTVETILKENSSTSIIVRDQEVVPDLQVVQSALLQPDIIKDECLGGIGNDEEFIEILNDKKENRLEFFVQPEKPSNFAGNIYMTGFRNLPNEIETVTTNTYYDIHSNKVLTAEEPINIIEENVPGRNDAAEAAQILELSMRWNFRSCEVHQAGMPSYGTKQDNPYIPKGADLFERDNNALIEIPVRNDSPVIEVLEEKNNVVEVEVLAINNNPLVEIPTGGGDSVVEVSEENNAIEAEVIDCSDDSVTNKKG